MIRAGLLSLAISVGVSFSPPVGAQTLPRQAIPQQGERIRLRGVSGGESPSVASGRFSGLEGDTLVLQVSRTEYRRFALEDLAKLEISAGKSRGAGAFRGMLIGTVGGASLGLLLGALSPEGCARCDSAGASMAIAAVGLGTLGLAGGLAIGAAVGVERWEVRWMVEGVR